MTVSNVSTFVTDPDVLVALVKSIATTAGVSEDHVTVTRQIQAVFGQDGIEHMCVLNYVITLPPGEPAGIVAESERIKTAFGLTKAETDENIEEMTVNFVTSVSQAVGSGVYSIQVRSISVPEVQVEHVQPTPPPGVGEEEDKGSASTGIIGGVIGAVSVLLIAACCVMLCCYVRNRRS